MPDQQRELSADNGVKLRATATYHAHQGSVAARRHPEQGLGVNIPPRILSHRIIVRRFGSGRRQGLGRWRSLQTDKTEQAQAYPKVNTLHGSKAASTIP